MSVGATLHSNLDNTVDRAICFEGPNFSNRSSDLDDFDPLMFPSDPLLYVSAHSTEKFHFLARSERLSFVECSIRDPPILWS